MITATEFKASHTWYLHRVVKSLAVNYKVSKDKCVMSFQLGIHLYIIANETEGVLFAGKIPSIIYIEDLKLFHKIHCKDSFILSRLFPWFIFTTIDCKNYKCQMLKLALWIRTANKQQRHFMKWKDIKILLKYWTWEIRNGCIVCIRLLSLGHPIPEN